MEVDAADSRCCTGTVSPGAVGTLPSNAMGQEQKQAGHLDQRISVIYQAPSGTIVLGRTWEPDFPPETEVDNFGCIRPGDSETRMISGAGHTGGGLGNHTARADYTAVHKGCTRFVEDSQCMVGRI